MPKYVFFDIDDHLLTTYNQHLRDLPNVELCDEAIDIRDMDDIDVYVSPANSYGWMNGGIDAVYSQMFPNVQKFVQEKIRKLGFLDGRTQRPVLPVGSATIVSVESSDKNTYQLACAPTMYTPMNISIMPENIYYAMYAILKVTEYLPVDYKVGVPGMGTGVGGVDPEESAKQIRRAFVDYQKGKPNYPDGTNIYLDKGDSYLVSIPRI